MNRNLLRCCTLVGSGAVIVAATFVAAVRATADATTVATVGATAAPTYQTNGVAWATAYANGVVYVGGSFTSVRPAGAAAGSGEVARSNFAAFDALSGALLPCAPAVTISSGATVRALTPSGDGKTLYIGGYFSSVGGQPHSSIAALDTTTCTVKSSFTASAAATVRAIATNSGSAVYFGGDFHAVNGHTRNLVAAVDETGALTAWDPNAVAPANSTLYTSVRALTVSADNTRVVLGGDFDYVNGGVYAHRLAIVDATTGAVLNTFGSFIDQTSAVKALTHDANNFYLGAEGTGGGVFDGRASFNIYSGALNWRDNCLGATEALAVAGDVLYSGSHAHDCHTTTGGYWNGARHHLLAQAVSDATIEPWFPNTNDGINEQIGPRGLTVGPDGSLWVVGEFTTVNGVNQQGITRFKPKPDNNVPTAPVPTLASKVAGQIQVRWRTTSDLDVESLTYRLYRDGAVVNTQTAKSRFFDRPQLSYTDSVAPGSFHVYRLDVSDGTNVSALGGTVGGTAATTSSAYAGRVLADQPANYWRLDDPNNALAADSAGNNPGIFPTGVLYRQPGATQDGDTAVTFTGDQNFSGVDGIQANNIQPGPTTYSTELWFKTTTTTGGVLVGFGDFSRTNNGTDASANYDRHIYMTNSGQLIFGNWIGYASTVASPKSYNDGTWHYVVATLGANGQRLFVDGAQVGAVANAGAQPYSGYWRIGNGNTNGWPTRPSTAAFAGSIDDVAVYSVALSANQVYQHYTGTAPPAPKNYPQAVLSSGPASYWRLGDPVGAAVAADASGQGDFGNVSGGVTFGQVGVVPADTDGAAAFDGSTASIVSTYSANDPEVFSTELWFKTTATTGGELLSFGNDPSSASTNYDRSIFMTNSGQLNFGIYNNGCYVVTSPNSYNDGNWHYVVVTLGSDGMTMYVDGLAVGSNPNATAQSYGGWWKAGGDNLNGWPNQPTTTRFSGTLDEVAIYPSTLSAADVAAHYGWVHQ